MSTKGDEHKRWPWALQTTMLGDAKAMPRSACAVIVTVTRARATTPEHLLFIRKRSVLSAVYVYLSFFARTVPRLRKVFVSRATRVVEIEVRNQQTT